MQRKQCRSMHSLRILTASVSLSSHVFWLYWVIWYCIPVSSILYGSYTLSSPLPQGCLNPKGKNFLKTLCLGLSHLRSLPGLHNVSLSISAFLFICLRKKCLTWWLSKARIYKYSRISLRVFFLATTHFVGHPVMWQISLLSCNLLAPLRICS